MFCQMIIECCKFLFKEFFLNLSLWMYISPLRISFGPLDFCLHNIKDNILIKQDYEVYKKAVKSIFPYRLTFLFFSFFWNLHFFLWIMNISWSPNVLLAYVHLVVHWRTIEMWLKTRNVNVLGMEMDHIWLFQTCSWKFSTHMYRHDLNF